MRPSDDTILAELLVIAEISPALRPQFGSLVAAHQYLPLYRLLARRVSEGLRVLDWGAGNGHFAYFLDRAGFKRTAFAIDEALPSWLGISSAPWVTGSSLDPVHLPFPTATFDVLTSVGVLEHVRETGGRESASMAEIARVLVPGGIFLCYHFPNRTSWIEFLADRVPGRHHHQYRYTRDDIVELTRAASLDLLEVGHYGFLPRNFSASLPAALRRSPSVARAWDLADGVLARLLPWLTQNYWFAARRSRL